jgi:uncharacterized protein YlaI
MERLKRKKCSVCKESKPIDNFYKDKNDRRGYRSYCKICAKQYNINNPEKIKNIQLKHHFGISLEEYNNMFKEQDGRCSICGKHQSRFKTMFSVDHDHVTGKIRGLLCPDCNHGLGNFKDTPRILQKAIEYLNKHK